MEVIERKDIGSEWKKIKEIIEQNFEELKDMMNENKWKNYCEISEHQG